MTSGPRVSSSRRRSRLKAPGSSARRRPDRAQGVLPLRPPTRSGAQKIRHRDERPPIGRRLSKILLGLTAAVILANAIAGERGLVQTAIARREYLHLADSVARLQRENRQLALQADRLRHDRSAIEELARRELGLIRPGEQLFIIADRPGPCPRRWQAASTAESFDRTRTACYHPNRFCFQSVDAGWSSPVARWAHNPKVGGSNPPPATNKNGPK